VDEATLGFSFIFFINFLLFCNATYLQLRGNIRLKSGLATWHGQPRDTVESNKTPTFLPHQNQRGKKHMAGFVFFNY
jgi:hypothetical protein